MSLLAASFTKSAVAGVIPSIEFTPVFSPTDTDCARAGVARKKHALLAVVVLIGSSSLGIWGENRPERLWFQHERVRGRHAVHRPNDATAWMPPVRACHDPPGAV